MGLGAQLIADDRCILRDVGAFVEITRPPDMPELIEARGVGLIKVPCAGPAPLHLIVDLDIEETDRLPKNRVRRILGHDVALLYNLRAGHFAAAIFAYIKSMEI